MKIKGPLVVCIKSWHNESIEGNSWKTILSFLVVYPSTPSSISRSVTVDLSYEKKTKTQLFTFTCVSTEPTCYERFVFKILQQKKFMYSDDLDIISFSGAAYMLQTLSSEFIEVERILYENIWKKKYIDLVNIV